jgi:hypothetical protein
MQIKLINYINLLLRPTTITVKGPNTSHFRIKHSILRYILNDDGDENYYGQSSYKHCSTI